MGLRVLNQGAEGPRRWEGGWYQGHPGSPGRSLSQGLEARAPVTPPPQPGPSARDLAPLRQDSAPSVWEGSRRPLLLRCRVQTAARGSAGAVQGREAKPAACIPTRSRRCAAPPAVRLDGAPTRAVPALAQVVLPPLGVPPPPPPQDAGPRTHCTPLPGALLELGAVFNQKSVSRAKRLDICLHTG